MTAIDLSILDFIQTHLRNAFCDLIMPRITVLGNAGVLWILLTLALLCIPRTRRLGITLTAALIMDVILCNGILKPLVARIRPYDINTAVRLLVARPTDFSFPSGHAAASFTAVSALYFRRSKLWIPSFIVALLISYSRLYLYVHYPSDVLAGIVLGIALGWLAKLLTDRIFRRLDERKRKNAA